LVLQLRVSLLKVMQLFWKPFKSSIRACWIERSFEWYMDAK